MTQTMHRQDLRTFLTSYEAQNPTKLVRIKDAVNLDYDSTAITFEFEKRRNVPVRYDRDLVQNTLKAMQRVGEIRRRREHTFWKHR